MGNRHRLLGMGNSELLAKLSELARQSNDLTAQLLAYLVEVEQRMLHVELGFSSLFAYCVEALGMSEGSAGRRVTAARVCRRFPEVFERVARGELHLCALCALASHLNPENAVELFDASRGKTRRQVEELLAVRFPRPDVREQIRRLPVRAQVPVAAVEQTSPPQLASDSGPPAAAREVPTVVRKPAAVAVPPVHHDRRPAREIEPLSADRFGVHFTADAELRELIERAWALASHRLRNGDLASLVKLMAASFVHQEEKRRFGIGARPRGANRNTKPARVPVQQTPPGGVAASPEATEPTMNAANAARAVPDGGRGRYVAVAVRRETHARDRGRCTFVSADGRRCNARGFLEFDHVEPYAKSGASDARNIRLLCRAHNLLHARNCFGALHLAAKIAANRRRKPASTTLEPR